MFAPEPAVPPLHTERHHPDGALAARVQAALNWWLSTPREAGLVGAPTSALTGGGAVAALEREFGRRHGDRPALLQPSATYALRAALDALSVGPGDEVLLPALDWTASRHAVLSLGARPVPTAVEPDTLTISPAAAAADRTERTAAVVACHLHGVAADIPALRRALPGVPIVEDCAAALGSTLDGRPVGTFGDFAVFSLGPGKTIDAGEGGILLTSSVEMHQRAIRRTAHPLRQLLTGLHPDPNQDGLSIRPHPITAILALHGLTRWDADEARRRYARSVAAVGDCGRVLGWDGRRQNAQDQVPVHVAGDGPAMGDGSGAVNLAAPKTVLHGHVEQLRRPVRLIPCRSGERSRFPDLAHGSPDGEPSSGGASSPSVCDI